MKLPDHPLKKLLQIVLVVICATIAVYTYWVVISFDGTYKFHCTTHDHPWGFLEIMRGCWWGKPPYP
jgi:radical SAM superfamily enzyme YgiQ (UPF0313 family)